MFRIAFLSVDGNCRSHMAYALAQELVPAGVEIVHLGKERASPLPEVVDVCREMGVEVSGQACETLASLGFKPINLVIELSQRIAANRSVIPGITSVLSWHMPEPVATDGQVQLVTLRQIYADLKEKIKVFFNDGYFTNLLSQHLNNELILDEFTDGILTHDANRKIIWINRAAERILGCNRTDIIGNDCFDLFPEKFCAGQCEHCRDFHTPACRTTYPIELVTHDKQKHYINMSVLQINDEHQVFQGVTVHFRDETEVNQLRKQIKETKSFHGIIGADSKMQNIYGLIRDVAASDCTVLIQGASGTGKELVAMAIHQESRRYDKPMVTVNCGALPENILESELFGHVRGAFTGAIRDKKGRFTLADGGTIFLDEIGELTPGMQIKLLRVLQERTFDPVGADAPVSVDVRVLSATNQNLKAMVQEGRFREDLYYRLCVVPITVPTLRERKKDIPLLVNHFVNLLSKESGASISHIHPEVMDFLSDYAWPGNIRELQNAIQYALIKCKEPELLKKHFPQEILDTPLGNESPAVGRKRKLTVVAITEALKESKGNKVKAAQLLGVGRATLYRSLNDHKN